ncbi:SDR family oxidoreductase [Paenibacillus luteus]|uniref:SDR family oxidoreductase n=1 Tax=Paenibacillus luteus TaxID=2545753 RepID=UPI001144E7CD|nr:NmrA family NAD(P)-binding protein [Paenibacillus luteus]
MSEAKKKVLVYGAAGVQGGAVAQKLIKDGYEVYAIARSKDKESQLRSAGIHPVIGELGQLDSLVQAHANIDIVYLQLPVDFHLSQVRSYIKHAVEAAITAKAQLLVVNTNVYVPEHETDATAIEIKRELKDAVRHSGLPYIFLQPTLYLENLCLPGILQGNVLAYPVPAQQPLSWVSIDDAAAYALYAIQHPELAGQTLQIHGSEALSGNQLAELFSKALARPVSFHSLAIDNFKAALTPLLGAETSAGLAGLYSWIQNNSESMPLPDGSASSLLPDLGGTSTEAWIQQAISQGIFK